MAKKSSTTSAIAETTSVSPAAGLSVHSESKKVRLIGMLSQQDGSTIAAISAALGWQGHTVRAAITRLRKAGRAVQTAKPADGGTGLIYRIASTPEEQAHRPAGVEAAQ